MDVLRAALETIPLVSRPVVLVILYNLAEINSASIWGTELTYWAPNLSNSGKSVIILILEKGPYQHMVPDHTRATDRIGTSCLGGGASSRRSTDVMETTDGPNADDYNDNDY